MPAEAAEKSSQILCWTSSNTVFNEWQLNYIPKSSQSTPTTLQAFSYAQTNCGKIEIQYRNYFRPRTYRETSTFTHL